MMRHALLFVAALIAVILPGAANAQQFKRKQPIELAPTQGYLLFRGDRKVQITLIRQPDAKTLEGYRALRKSALEDAHRAYESALERYAANPAASEKPLEPTDQNFLFPPIEAQRAIWIIGDHPVIKDKELGYHYLTGLPPGTYTLYGNVYPGMQGWVGTCMCMGSVSFDLVAGQVVDIGSLDYPGLLGIRVAPETIGALLAQGRTTLRLTPPQPGQSYPQPLTGLPIRPAELRAAGKLANFHGIQIDRLTPIPGVLDYRQGEVIDVRTGEALR